MFKILFPDSLFLLPLIQGINGHKTEDQHISRKFLFIKLATAPRGQVNHCQVAYRLWKFLSSHSHFQLLGRKSP